MIGRDYLKRQAMTLLKFARATKDPQTHVKLAAKAAELQARVTDMPKDTAGAEQPPCEGGSPKSLSA